MDIPIGHEYYVDATYYKTLVHGKSEFVMMWNVGAWKRSGKSVADLKRKRKDA